MVGRQLATQLSELWGQPVVVENRPGAGATVGSAHVAAQPADGYTIMIASVTFTMNPAGQQNLPFDPATDFTPVAMTGQAPLVIGARPEMTAESQIGRASGREGGCQKV